MQPALLLYLEKLFRGRPAGAAARPANLTIIYGRANGLWEPPRLKTWATNHF